MEAGWSAWRVARQVGHSDFTVRRCSDKWTENTSFTWKPGSGHPRLTSRLEDRHTVRHARVELTVSLAAVQTQTAPSLRVPVFFRTIVMRLAEGQLPMTSITSAANDTYSRHFRLEWCRA
ncbi:transposable element Tcb2 transposase [Trichonephila clavipes]|nr:transposable element Tcb2 transposase [Trichonephila clavipes]